MATILDRDMMIREIEQARKEVDNDPTKPEGAGTFGFLSRSIAVVANHLARNTRRAVDDLEERVRKLEAQQSALPYKGVWSADAQYSPGDFATDHGSMWYCRESTRDRPGESSRGWVLAVKKGRDGRDTR